MEDDISFAPIQQSMSIVVEDDAVARLGYKPELKRSFGAFGMLGFAFSIVTCWTALSGVLIVGVTSGGPPVIIWSWLGICTFSLAVAYSMAEMCSAYPVAGGQYSWTAILAPPKMARAFSYLNGWFMIIGIVATGAVNNFITANYLLGMANLNYPDFVIERWHTTLCAYAVGAFALFVNVGIPAVLDKMSLSLLIWNIGAFLTIIVVVLAMNDNKRSADFVFKDFVNLTGWNRSYTTIIGLLQTAWGMCCYDAPAHMTEEIKHARKQAPRAIILSVWMGAFTGFIFLIVICFSIGDIDATATSSTGVPLIQIFHDSTDSNIAATILTVLITVISFGASNSLTAEAGRSIYAFARDEGLPFSGIWKMIEKRRQIPVYALCLTCLVQAAFVSIYFGTVTGFNTIISIASAGFYLSYAMPLLGRVSSSFTSNHREIHGLYYLGKLSLPLNIAGLLYLTFAIITFNFPSAYPVSSDNMNYTIAAIGAIMCIAFITWITTARHHFHGPDVSHITEGSERPMPMHETDGAVHDRKQN